ncbi:hypothetical protein EIN_034140 [Entamoeba invadens IP1]|uniref:Uncharacterized protein n=1 Tax=Entamoeba invadens IP1 TaxID=370355 RepID=A0A0A1U1M2_ENTIV|nr:hypothetical protein EIN_034140 [Entamoeba invadens IP1]ELP86503.1 hypothetical protein EIN_034140 [Entamoeba invadens IP1]|eukprot:XP_004185849.1 hypothetical protein EIN_034140 [Entamoeba invadens IP1]
MYRLDPYTIENSAQEHNQLRTSNRMALLGAVRHSIPEFKPIPYNSNLTNDDIPKLCDMIRSSDPKDVIKGLNFINRMIQNRRGAISLICPCGLLPRLAELAMSTDCSIQNFAVQISALLASESDPQHDHQYIECGLCARYAQILSTPFDNKYLNIFENAARGIANVMFKSVQNRDVCLSYGFFEPFFHLCEIVYKTKPDPTIPAALGMVMKAITYGKPKPDDAYALSLLPLVHVFSNGFEGDIIIFMLETLKNISEFPRLVEILKNNENIQNMLVTNMGMHFADFQSIVLQVVQNCVSVLPQFWTALDKLFEKALEVLQYSVSPILPQLFTFMENFLEYPSCTQIALKYLSENERGIAFIVSETASQSTDCTRASLKLIRAILLATNGKAPQLIQMLNKKGLLQHMSSCLQRNFIQKDSQCAQLITDTIFLDFNFNQDDATLIEQFEESKGVEALDTVLIYQPQLLQISNQIKKFVFTKPILMENL